MYVSEYMVELGTVRKGILRAVTNFKRKLVNEIVVVFCIYYAFMFRCLENTFCKLKINALRTYFCYKKIV